MTPARLAHIKACFANPASASIDAALGLELIEALEQTMGPDIYVVDTSKLPVLVGQTYTTGDAESIVKALTDAVDSHAAPTPPIRETKRKAK